jgi:hypothetical protein
MTLVSAAFIASAMQTGVGASAVPTKGVVEVTGYGHVGLDGNSGPVVVVAKGAKAAAILTALAGLAAPSPSVPDCMESGSAFEVSVLTRVGARPGSVATEQDCPSPGLVVITVGGRITQRLAEDCSLRSAVVAALSRGQAEGTRRDPAGCSSFPECPPKCPPRLAYGPTPIKR